MLYLTIILKYGWISPKIRSKLIAIYRFIFIYLFHSKAPWFHSWYNPMSKIKIKNKLVIVQFNKFEDFIIMIIGKIKAISTSKIKKIIAIKKNRREKGKRE